MNARRLFFVISLALVVAALPWGIDQSWAQSSTSSTQQQGGREVAVTDVTGRVHNLMPRMTHAERKAAAQRAKAARAEEGGFGIQGTYGPQGEVTK